MTDKRPPLVRPFYLYRMDDVSGLSGTGIVAIGVVLPSGRAVLEWRSRWPTLTVFRSAEEIIRIHGHGGRTVLVWGFPGSGNPAPSGPPWPLAAPPTPRRRWHPRDWTTAIARRGAAWPRHLLQWALGVLAPVRSAEPTAPHLPWPIRRMRRRAR